MAIIEEKNKPMACLEISSESIKLLIGDVANETPYVLYTKDIPCDGLIKDGIIADKAGLVKKLASLKSIEDENAKIKISISEVSLLVPATGFRVFTSEHTTNVVSEMSIIASLDLSNAISLIMKDKIPENDSVVDIIPQKFVLDDGSVYTEPPLGKKSSAIKISAMVHTLPRETLREYQDVVTAAGFRIRKTAVSPYCIAELNKLTPDFPKNYYLIDEGARATSITFIGNNTPFRCITIHHGGDDLTASIAGTFGISKEEAEDLKIRYGYCKRRISYNPPIAKSIDETGKEEFYYQEDLNAIIESYYKHHFGLVTNAINTLNESVKIVGITLPIILCGGASQLAGATSFYGKEYPSCEVSLSKPRFIGAYNTRYNGLLGLVLTGKRYSGSLEDNHHGIPSVERVKKVKEKKASTDLEDNL